MNTKALRQKILDLAIHGKLVPQDPNDEPASVLLERIKAEKERLIKEGKIKRTKRSKAACDKPHYPYELPKGWCWTTLGDIAESNIGLTYKPSDICLDGIPVYRSNNIKNGHIDLSDVVRVNTKILEKQFLNEGDLLICARNGSRRLVGKNAIISQLGGPAAFGAFMAVCRSSYNPWICLVLNTTYFDRYLDDSNSATINQVTQSMLLAFPVPFPPKNEQDRIINEVAQLESVIANINDNIDCLNTVIKQTKSKILNLAIHGKLVPQDPTDEPAYELLKRINPKAEITCDNPHYRNLPEGWAAAPMQMLCSLVDGEKQSGVERINLDVKFLRGEREAKALSAGKYVAANTLLILVDGENSGEVFRTPVEGYQGSTFKQLAINDNMYTDYVLQVINLHRKTLRENKVGSAIPHLNKKLFKTIDVPIPPYEEQQRIVNAINEAFTTLDAIAKNL